MRVKAIERERRKKRQRVREGKVFRAVCHSAWGQPRRAGSCWTRTVNAVKIHGGN